MAPGLSWSGPTDGAGLIPFAGRCPSCCRIGEQGGDSRAQHGFLLVFLLVCFLVLKQRTSIYAGCVVKFVFRRWLGRCGLALLFCFGHFLG
ncbi:MAG: hypothetical protein JSS31_00910 [Proteobacteria bacterium]|nr:hypothetical protein [Pseudomonadota bacterium]MBS0492513.1 hypothetical protein [Pseudomonadota bacterium]